MWRRGRNLGVNWKKPRIRIFFFFRRWMGFELTTFETQRRRVKDTLLSFTNVSLASWRNSYFKEDEDCLIVKPDTYKLSKTTTRTLLDNDETVLDQSFADISFRSGIMKCGVLQTVAPITRNVSWIFQMWSYINLREFNIQLQRLVKSILCKHLVSFDLIFFVNWQDSPSEHILVSVCGIFCEGGWKNSKTSCWYNLNECKISWVKSGVKCIRMFVGFGIVAEKSSNC